VTCVFVCHCVVPKYECVGVVVMSAPLTVGSSPCLCSSVVYRCGVDLIVFNQYNFLQFYLI
jgi:hypothetical protein